MSPFVVQMLVLSWIPIAVVLFRRFDKPIAVILVVMLGQMFLPEVQSIPASPEGVKAARLPLLEFSKHNVISYGLLLAIIITDLPRLQRFRFRVFDIPAIVLSLSPSISALINGTGIVESFTHFRNATLTWGVPYVLGRIYLGDALGCYRIVAAIAVGGLIYVPFCLWEMRMGPTLHQKLFGFHQHSFVQTLRGGGYRPTVFMQHGLVVGFWMVSASLCAITLWRASLWPLPWYPPTLRRHAALAMVAIVGTAGLCRSLGAMALGFAGGFVHWLSQVSRTRLFFFLLLVAPISYTLGRTTGVVSGEFVTSIVGKGVAAEREKSLGFRLECEDEFLAVVAKQPIIGMGANPKARPVDEDGQPVVSDAMWIILFFDTGYVGLLALLSFFLYPAWKFARQNMPISWRSSEIAPASICATILILTMSDFCVNGLINPVFILMVAALTGWNQSTCLGRKRP